LYFRCLKNNKIFEWITSPSARILTSNYLFARTHSNIGKGRSTAQAFSIAAYIMLSPRESILHETTGNIASTIACHGTHNLISTLVAQPLVNAVLEKYS
jgi:hypothetical protein